jgi:hypothetical protein
VPGGFATLLTAKVGFKVLFKALVFATFSVPKVELFWFFGKEHVFKKRF